MKQKLSINYIPPTANERENIARTNKYLSASSKKTHTQRISLMCHQQKLSKMNGLIYMDITFYVKNINRDWDNLLACFKYINDGLVKAGVINNDNLNNLRPDVILFEKDKEDRIEIVLKEEHEKTLLT